MNAPVLPITSVAEILRDAANYLDRHGWIQGCYYDQAATVFTPAACLVGAIGMVCYGGPVDAPAQQFDAPQFGAFEAAVAFLDHYVSTVYGFDCAYSFNDVPGRRAVEVTEGLRAAACAWEREHPHPPVGGGA